MKHKISGISGLGIVILLVSLFSWATPVSAGTASWSAESIPSTIDHTLGPAGIDIRDIAVAGGTTIYAVAGDSISNNVVYKSTDTGVSWTTINVDIEADLVAVAPDDADVVAITNSSTPEVYLTINGGSIWYNLGTPQESGGGASAAAIYDLAISPASGETHYIAAAGKEAGDANVWYFNTGATVPVWKETNSLAGFSGASEVAAVAFSPSFSSDKAMVAITEADGVSIKLQIFSMSYEKWNGSANLADFPITIVSDDGITGLTSASLSLDPDYLYLASEASQRTVFIGLAVSGDAAAINTSGIYRLRDTTKTALQTGTKIHSIAFNGTYLVAGRYDTATVYRSSNPMVTSTTPTISAVHDAKGPGGENKVVVAWAGSKVAAGTSGGESAFAISTTSGEAFNDISLIDTDITYIRDVAVSTDGNKVYLVTDNGTNLSLWRKVSTWVRVLSQQGTADYIVRIAPDDADSVYVAKKGGTTVYYNDSGGDTKWLTRTCTVNIQDLAVESADVAYALNSTGSVSKTTDAGFLWETTVSTKLNSGATIISVSTDNLLVGSQDGYVAYSPNGNSSWTDISQILQSGAGKVQVTADTNFASNSIIYAASDAAGQDIKRWQIGTSTRWTDIFSGTISGSIYGLATDNGTLYALEFDAGAGQSKLWQCLSPTATTITSESWSYGVTTASTDADDTTVHLNATPRALKVSSGKLWAVKTNGTNKLYSFTDILIKVTVLKPASGFINPVNEITGTANDILFSWARPAEATKYELQIAYDSDFIAIVATVTVESEESSVYAIVGQNQTGTARVNFMAGTNYYWRVRTVEPLYGLYSTAQIFSIKPLALLGTSSLTPANGSTGISRKPAFSWNLISTATEYQFVLSDNAESISPIIDTRVKNAGFAMTEELDYGRTYFWKVRATEPVQSNWSILANFTVGEDIATVPPLVIQYPPQPAPIINVPEPLPPDIVTIPPPAAPAVPSPIIPDNYIRTAIIIGAILLLVVIALIIKGGAARPFRVPEGFGGFGGGLGNLREGLVNYFKDFDFNQLRKFIGANARIARTVEAEASHPISFAAESFLWMMTSEEKEESKRLLSADEEQALGKILASRIQAIAKDQFLCQKFPKEASLFLYLWSHYGSRDETNRYLTDSLRSRPENVVRLLKCYLTTPRGQEPGLTRKTDFSRAQYDSVAKVVDPNKVYEALTRLYGPDLDRLEDEEAGYSSDKTIASQFARIHHLVRSEVKKAGKTAWQTKTGIVGAGTR